MEDSWKYNIEGIINKLKDLSKLTIKFRKMDGITFEGRTAVDGDREAAIKEMDKLLLELELVPYSILKSNELSNVYIVEFFELDIRYSNKEKIKQYENSFKFLIDNLRYNAKNEVTRGDVLNAIDVITKQTIQIYYRSNINKYKMKVEELLNDKEYREHLDKLFINYVTEYFKAFDVVDREGK